VYLSDHKYTPLTIHSAVIGDVNGEISAVFGKLGALHAKNNFSFALIVGELFSSSTTEGTSNDEQVDSLLDGQIDVPLPTYFALGKRILPDKVAEKLTSDSGELCNNLFFLGRRTTTKTSEGVKIVALGGAYQSELLDEKTSLNEYSPINTEADVKVLKGANNADIVITSEWPVDIRTGSQVAFPGEETPVAQQSVTDLCSYLKPRYHFSTSNSFFEREPFFHSRGEDESEYRVTRFISLAPYGNPSKQKWIYAFSLDPKADLPTTIPTGVTASPLNFNSKKRKALEADPSSYSRFGNGNGQSQSRRGKKARQPPPTPQQCFFCLSNPNIASHLISSIGEAAYLTTAKGPLTTNDTFPALGFPGHMLIIPLEHSPTLGLIKDVESRQATTSEMHRYRQALYSMIAARSKDAPEKQKMGAVTWEISRAGGIHVHWQFLPVLRDMATRGLVEAAFKVEAENETYPAFQTSTASDNNEEAEIDGDYFKATIWADGQKDKIMVLQLDSSFRFDLQFGRRVLAKLLGLEKRMDWRDSAQTEVEETADVESFKAAFKEFDFSLEE